MYEPFNYSLSSLGKARRRMRMHQIHIPPEEIIDANNKVVDRLKSDLDLHEESTIADLRAAAARLSTSERGD